jgi:hypothetical protein
LADSETAGAPFAAGKSQLTEEMLASFYLSFHASFTQGLASKRAACIHNIFDLATCTRTSGCKAISSPLREVAKVAGARERDVKNFLRTYQKCR